MNYFVRIDSPVEDYISSVEGLSDAGRAAGIDGVTDELGRDANKFLRKYPPGRESLHFRYDYVQPDDPRLYNFDFIVDGTQMASGVVTIVFVECDIVSRF